VGKKIFWYIDYVKKYWSYLVLIGVVLEMVSLFTERQFAFSAISLLFSLVLYVCCYLDCRTWPLTLTLVFYPLIFLGFCGVFASTYFAGISLRQTQLAYLDGWSIVTACLSLIYLAAYLVLTWKVRKINKRLSFGPRSY
jgi:hypothetical protein